MNHSENTEISIIIPTYKPGEYILECLDSIRNQTLSPDSFEILVVLNGCKEPYLSMLKGYADSHPEHNIRLIHTDVAGVSNARNIGLDSSRGKYIALMDDDDLISPTYLESMLRLAETGIIPLSNVESFDDLSGDSLPDYIGKGIRKLRDTGKTVFHDSQVSKCLNVAWAKLIPATIIGNKRFDPNFSNGEDSLFLFDLVDRSLRFGLTSPDALYRRRIRIGSATKRHRGYRYWIQNWTSGVAKYSRIYFSNPAGRSIPLYINRVLAISKTNLLLILKGG